MKFIPFYICYIIFALEISVIFGRTEQKQNLRSNQQNRVGIHKNAVSSNHVHNEPTKKTLVQKSVETTPDDCPTTVNKSSIIRTQDSIDNGAKFLDTPILKTEYPYEECIKQCCEISDCDVAVFGHKESDSCYLFSCNGNCLFTPHPNYKTIHISHESPFPSSSSSENNENELTDMTTKKKKSRKTTTTSTTTTTTTTKKPTTTTRVKPTTQPKLYFVQIGDECSKYRVCNPSHSSCVKGICTCDEGYENRKGSCGNKGNEPEQDQIWDYYDENEVKDNKNSEQSDNSNSGQTNGQKSPNQGEADQKDENQSTQTESSGESAHDNSDKTVVRPVKTKPKPVTPLRKPVNNNSSPKSTKQKENSTKKKPRRPRPTQAQSGKVRKRPPLVQPTVSQPKTSNTINKNSKTSSKESPNSTKTKEVDVKSDDKDISALHHKGSESAHPHKGSDREEKDNDVSVQKYSILNDVNISNGPAIIALSLGLSITFLMLVIVACRLRTVKKKLRKGRPLDSYEADYLINGMYL